MAKGIWTVQIKGLAGVIQRNNAFMESVVDGTDEIINLAAREAENGAQANCKVPSIAATIKVISGSANHYILSAGLGLQNPNIAAYLEFGTGNFAAAYVPGIPKDWQELAQTFYVNGLGRMPASPYLYPAFLAATSGTVNEISKMIERLGRRYSG